MLAGCEEILGARIAIGILLDGKSTHEPDEKSKKTKEQEKAGQPESWAKIKGFLRKEMVVHVLAMHQSITRRHSGVSSHGSLE